MNFRNAFFGAVLLAVPGQASIITQNANDPNLGLVQNFSSPNQPIGSNYSPVTTQFQTPGVGLTFSTPSQQIVTAAVAGVVYDPNQLSNPSQGCSAFGLFAPDKNCVTNYTLDSFGNYSQITTTSFTFTLAAPATQVAFFLFMDQQTNTTPQTVISVNGNNALSGTFSQTFNNNWFLVDLGGPLISSITISGLNASTAIAQDGSAYGLVLSHVETNSPEPGTILLFGTGLGAVTFFARRRKA